MEKKKSFLSVKEIVEIALLLSLAVVFDLSGLKIGHAGFNMVPLILIAYRHDPIKSGIIIGIVYAIINMAFDSWQINIVSLIFDYILGYGCIALLGLFAKKAFSRHSKHIFNIFWLILSIVVISLSRVLFSSIGGYILGYAPTFVSSFWLNLSIYVGWDCLLALIAFLVLYPTIILINKRFPTDFTKKFE